MPPRHQPGLRINAAADVPQILIYDDIGPEWLGLVSAKGVTEALEELKASREINVRINSPGGDVFEGFGIYNALVRHPAKIIVDIDALAASAASLIAMSGDRIRIAANAMIMVHQAWTIAAGNAAELLKVVEILEKIGENLVDTYVARTGQDAKTVQKMLDDETWLQAAEAVEQGFADEIGTELQVAALVAQGRYRNTPERFRRDSAADDPPRQIRRRDLAELRAMAAKTRALRGLRARRAA